MTILVAIIVSMTSLLVLLTHHFQRQDEVKIARQLQLLLLTFGTAIPDLQILPDGGCA